MWWGRGRGLSSARLQGPPELISAQINRFCWIFSHRDLTSLASWVVHARVSCLCVHVCLSVCVFSPNKTIGPSSVQVGQSHQTVLCVIISSGLRFIEYNLARCRWGERVVPRRLSATYPLHLARTRAHMSILRGELSTRRSISYQLRLEISTWLARTHARSHARSSHTQPPSRQEAEANKAERERSVVCVCVRLDVCVLVRTHACTGVHAGGTQTSRRLTLI